MTRGPVTARTLPELAWRLLAVATARSSYEHVDVTMEGDVSPSEMPRSHRKAAGPSLLFAALLLAPEPLRAQTPGASLVAQRVDQPPRLEDFVTPNPPAGGVRVE